MSTGAGQPSAALALLPPAGRLERKSLSHRTGDEHTTPAIMAPPLHAALRTRAKLRGVATTRRSYAVIGDPVEHSLSPRIFSRFFAELGIDAHYTAMRTLPDELPQAIERVRRGALSGLSLTIPHKEAAVELVDAIHPAAARIGAVNCVWRTPSGHVQGFNTDAAGFRLSLEGAQIRLAAARVVLLGAGGAARAAAFATVAGGAKGLSIVNRDRERAQVLGLDLVASGRAWPEGELLRRWEGGERVAPGHSPDRALGGPSGKCFVASAPLEEESIAQALLHADILVNATSVGLGDPTADPLPAGCVLGPRLSVLDMVYRPTQTALLRRARAGGAKVIDGLWMLLHQANEQLRLWTGRMAPPSLLSELHGQLALEFA